jgi:hypothetical protein
MTQGSPGKRGQRRRKKIQKAVVRVWDKGVHDVSAGNEGNQRSGDEVGTGEGRKWRVAENAKHR